MNRLKFSFGAAEKQNRQEKPTVATIVCDVFKPAGSVWPRLVIFIIQSVREKHRADGLGSEKVACPHCLCALCSTGRKTGRAGCRLLCDSVQTSRSSPHGPRAKQLQKVRSPQPVRHPQEPVHQRHAGSDTWGRGGCLSVVLTFCL